jgi:hypothetical protein
MTGEKMLERRTNVSQFEGVNALQKDIERLTKERDALAKERENSQTKLLEEHGVALEALKSQLGLLIERTKESLSRGHRFRLYVHRNTDRRCLDIDVSSMRA